MDIITTNRDNELLLENVKCNRLDIIKSLVEQNRVNIDYVDGYGLVALHYAAAHGHYAIVEYLINKGADIQSGRHKITPVCYAMRNKHTEIVDFLVQHGVRTKGIWLNELLLIKADCGDLNAIESLVELDGVNINYCDKNTGTALHHAARRGHRKIIFYLISRGANINAKYGEDNITPLRLAIETNHKKVAKILTQHGAKTDNIWLNKLFLESANCGKLFKIKILVDSYVLDINYCDKNTGTALHHAAKRGEIEKILYLILKGANINAKYGKDNITPIRLAIENNHKKVVEILLQQGAKTDNIWLNKLLLESVVCDDLEKMLILINLDGVDINYCDENTGTVLHHAARGGHRTIIEHLIQKGANVNAKYGEDNITPLRLAIENFKSDTAEILLRYGARNDVIINSGENILDVTMMLRAHSRLLAILIDHGLEINQYNRNGYTPLLQAFATGRLEIVACLLKKGADYRKYSIPHGLSLLLCRLRPEETHVKLILDHVGRIEGKGGMLEYVNHQCITNGYTGLHYACEQRNYPVAKLLLHCGANSNIRNKEGLTPHDILVITTRQEAVRIRLFSLFNSVRQLEEEEDQRNRRTR